MSHPVQRVVALVPLTALLVSGALVAAPALADESTAPQAYVDGFDTTYTSNRIVVDPGPVTIDFDPQAFAGRDSFTPGIYWVRIIPISEVSGLGTIRFVELPDVREPGPVRWVLDATRAGRGDRYLINVVRTDRRLADFGSDDEAMKAFFAESQGVQGESTRDTDGVQVDISSALFTAFELSWVGVQQDDATAVPPAFESIPTVVRPTDVFVGDWDGDGVDTPAYRDYGTNLFHMAPSLDATDLATWTPMAYGRAGQTVYIGDWDGNGTDTFGVRQPGTNLFQARNDFDGGPAQIETSYGRAGDEIVVGAFRAGGPDVLSVRRGNSFYLKYDFSGGEADLRTDFGRPDDVVVIGDWDADGADSPGVRRGNVYYLNNTFEGGAVPGVVVGEVGDKHLVAGLTAGGPDQILALWVDAPHLVPPVGE